MSNEKEQFSYEQENGQVAPFVYDESIVSHEEVAAAEAAAAASAAAAPASIFRKAIHWLVCAAAFLLPLWFLPVTFDVLDFNKQVLLVAIAVLGVVFYLIDMIKTGFLRFKPNGLFWVFGAFGAAGIVATIFSVNRWTSVFGDGISRSFSLLSIVSFGILFFLAVNFSKNEKSGNCLGSALTVSLALSLLLGVLQILGVKVLGWASSFSGFNTIGSVNTLAGLAAASIIFFTFNGNKNIGSVWLDWILATARYGGLVLALFIIVLINWWPVWTVAFISLLVSVAFGTAAAPRVEGQRRFTMRSFAMPMAMIVIGIFLMLINFNWASLKSKLSAEVSPSFKTSAVIALESIKQRPLGFGLENFGIAYDKFKPVSIVNSVFYRFRFVDGTSQLFNMAAEGGILMILAFLSLLWFYWKEISLFFKNKFFGNPENAKVWASSIGLLAMFFLFPINMAVMSVFVLMLALAVGPKYESDGQVEERIVNLETDAKYSFIGSLVFIVGLVLALVASYFTVNNFISNVYMAKAASSKESDKAVDYFVKSINSSVNDDRAYGFLAQTLVAKIAEDLKSGSKKDESKENYNARVQNMIVSAIDVATRETQINPADSQSWFNRGLIYQNLAGLVGGAEQAAVGMYSESLKRNPADPQTYLNIGNVYLTSADNIQTFLRTPPKDQAGKYDSAALKKQMDDSLDNAKQNFEKAVSLYNDFGQALFNLAVVYERQGKVPEAIKNFERLQANNQRDPSILFQLGLLYYKNNQKDKAIAAWERSVLLFPSYSNAHWYLSLAYEEKGDMDKAMAQAEEVLKLNPDNEMAKQRVEQLKSGQLNAGQGGVLQQKPLNQ